MLKINDIKKIAENSGLKFKEVENGLIIFKEEEFNYLFEIKQILKTFGVKDNDIQITDEGTIVNSKEFDAQKLKMLLSPFYSLDKMDVVDPYKLLIKGLFIDSLNEGEEADGSADDLGEVPTDSIEIIGVQDLAQLIDQEFPDAEITILGDGTLEITTSDDIVDFLKSIEDQLENFDITIDNNKILVKGIEND